MNRLYYCVPFFIQNLFFVGFLPIYKFFLGLEIKGVENLTNIKGPLILASNHTSELDPTVIPLVFPFLSSLLPIYSVIYPIEKYKTLDWKWRRYIYGKLFFNLLGGYSSYSGSKNYKQSLKDHISLLNKGRTVCIFPEGKCTIDGKLGNAHGGLGFLVYETNATVIPLFIDTFYGLSFLDFFLFRKKVCISVLPPLTKTDLFTVENPQVNDFREVSEKVMEKIRNARGSSIKSFVDYDKSLKLETRTFFRSVFSFFITPVLNNLPKNFKEKIKKTDLSAKEVIDNVTSHQALEVLYSKGKMFSTKSIKNVIFQNIWFYMDNSKAVRNRLKFVIRELKDNLELIATNDKEINIVSIASGSARAVIEVVEAGNYLDTASLSLTFVDKSDRAIDYSKRLSTKIQHLPIKMEWRNETVGRFLANPPDKKFDIVEMVGLLDYFNDQKTIETFKGIYAILNEGGILITANINHNKEEKFASEVIDWVMVYRTAEDLARLLVSAGFEENKLKVFYEPFRIHGIVVARK